MTSLIERLVDHYTPTMRDHTEMEVHDIWRRIEALRNMRGVANYKAQLADMRDTLDEIVRTQ